MQKYKKYFFIGAALIVLILVGFKYIGLGRNKINTQTSSLGAVLGVSTGTGDFPNEIIGTTNTQAVLTYTAPSSAPCSVAVSTSPTYLPLISDVDPALFASASLDSRPGSVTNGSYRVFVIGKRSADLALDGNRYSRALQAYTTYYYQVSCGGSLSSGQFTTYTIPAGLTYSDPIPSDGSGNAAWPTIGTSRSQQFTDPQTGLLISRASLLTDSGDPDSPTDLSLGSFGGPDVCNPTLVADNTRAMGYHCIISGFLYWINPATGDARPVGDMPDFSKKRVAKKITVKIISLGEGGQLAGLDERKQMPTEGKEVKSTHEIIYAGKVAHISLDDKENPVGVLIQNEAIHQTQKLIFNQLWKSL